VPNGRLRNSQEMLDGFSGFQHSFPAEAEGRARFADPRSAARTAPKAEPALCDREKPGNRHVARCAPRGFKNSEESVTRPRPPRSKPLDPLPALLATPRS
jgi:hypothetical protein